VPDKQVHPIGTEDAPADYVIPKSAELLLKSVHAKFDGSGAAGDFIPLVRIISDAGSTTDEIPQDVTVAAGGSADATWFPRVGAAAAAAPTGTVVAYAQGYSEFTSGDAVQNVAAGGHANGTHAHVSTTDANLLLWSTAVTTNDTLNVASGGTCLVWSTALWDNAATFLTSQIMEVGATGFRHNSFLPTGTGAFAPSDGLATSQDYNVYHVTAGSTRVTVLHQNGDVVGHGVQGQYLTAAYLATG